MKRGIRIGLYLLTAAFWALQAAGMAWADGIGICNDHLEESGNQRYVVISNPFHNRRERYPWEYFWRSINHQAIEKNSWWVLHFRKQKIEAEGPSHE